MNERTYTQVNGVIGIKTLFNRARVIFIIIPNIHATFKMGQQGDIECSIHQNHHKPFTQGQHGVFHTYDKQYIEQTWNSSSLFDYLNEVL